MEMDRVREETVSLIMAMRSEYLQAGASPLKHWDQLQDRMRAAARQSANVPQFVTSMSRSLSLGAPSNDRSLVIDSLTILVGEESSKWLDLVEEEHSYLMALCRLEAQQRKNNRATGERPPLEVAE